MTSIAWLDSLNDYGKAQAIAVIKRMGWSINTDSGDYLVTFPNEDENLFEFLDTCWI